MNKGDCDYNIHELLVEEVGGNSKTGLDSIAGNADKRKIYLALIGNYELKSRIPEEKE